MEKVQSLLLVVVLLGSLEHVYGAALDVNTTTSTTTPSTTTLPPQPGKVMLIIIPVATLVGIPLFIACFCCFTSMLSCAQKRKESFTNSRRVTPINDPEGSRVSDSAIFTYDGGYGGGGGGGGGLETQAHYNYGWDF